MAIKSIVGIILGLTLIPTAQAVTFTYSGTLEYIFADDGTGLYAGATIGDSYSGIFSAGNSASEGTPLLPCLNDECLYAFSGPSINTSISNGTATVTGTGSTIAIWNEYDLEVDDAAFINVLPDIEWAVGTLLDGWLGDSVLDNGALLSVGFVSRDTSLYSDLGYPGAPPDLSSTDLAFFTIEEFDTLGNTTFLGFGRLDAATIVPLPAAAWLFGSGLIGLLSLARRKL